MRAGSLNSKLAVMNVGDRIYLESDAEGVFKVQRQVSTHSRWPVEMTGWKFTTAAYTAFSARYGERPIYLVAIERTA